MIIIKKNIFTYSSIKKTNNKLCSSRNHSISKQNFLLTIIITQNYYIKDSNILIYIKDNNILTILYILKNIV